MKKKILAGLFMLLALTSYAQSQTETIKKTLSFASGKGPQVLMVENINGSVKVEAYNGDKVQLEAQKRISDKDLKEVEKGLREVQLVTKESGDSIYIYLEAPFIYRSRTHRSVQNNVAYHFNMDITLKVPAKTNLNIATVNEGEVEVHKVTGNIKARHVNGPIKLNNTTGSVDASTVNGPLEVIFAQNPTADSKFKTINGEVKVTYVPKLDANVTFKTMHGEFYTDLSDVELMPVRLIKNQNGSGGTVYRVDKNQQYKAGKGGPTLSFETLNGNIYLKKN
ncbi:DUF4097 family beta strand repeat-containing protein [Adhaeribacter aquaticus]|uniref:DUF4097 family beta strand repeat-containing protein n=1 Tax=Adhaeribacter aquaticus TaxID=299567 RepID=UPI00041A7D18|nr:hypothetical protein [Adhaeribacter aquaticus]